MPTSCLNPILISNAVAGTGVSVSLLIHALTPLCPKPTPPIETAANHIGTVITGYVCGFLPCGFFALFDIISAKWKSVRETRNVLFTLVPIVLVIAYGVIQGMSGDYKEMMTAVIALMLTLYHLARTA